MHAVTSAQLHARETRVPAVLAIVEPLAEGQAWYSNARISAPRSKACQIDDRLALPRKRTAVTTNSIESTRRVLDKSIIFIA